ncbi:MAG: uridine kinase [Patescibacteria group bacterium]
MNNGNKKPPFIIAIAGGTGSGKTYITKKIHEVAPDDIVSISHDNYYIDRRDVPMNKRDEINYDEPAALDNQLLLEHLKQLDGGNPIDIPQYDFATHMRKRETSRVYPAPIVIVEGILILTDPEIRSFFDLIVFIDVKPDVRLARRLQRDVHQRDSDYQSSINQYLVSAGPMHDKYVEPGTEYADLIINNNSSEDRLTNSILTLQSRIKDILGRCK